MAEKKTNNRETWRDWLPPGAPLPDVLYTRDELVRELEALDHGPRVTARDIAYWESEGVIPAAVRQWHNGAVRAIYPDWVLWLIVELRSLQQEGYTLSQIAIKLRSPVRVYLADQMPRNDEVRADIQRTISRAQEAPRETPSAADLRAALRKFTIMHGGLTGKMATQVEIVFRDASGSVIYTDDITIDTGSRATGTD